MIYIFIFKLVLKIDENIHSGRNIHYEIYEIRLKAKEQELGRYFIRIYPDKEDFNIFGNVNEIFRHSKQSF